MTEEHPNLTLLSKLDLRDLDASAALFAENFAWHYFNPNLPNAEGDYVGVEGLKDFFAIIAGETNGTFGVEPVQATPIGEELIVVQARDTLEHNGNPITIDVVVVWRIVEGKLAEAWDIPSAYSLAASREGNGAQA